MIIQTDKALADGKCGDLCKDSSSTLCILSSLANSIAKIADSLSACQVVDKCESLKDGKQYYLQSNDGKFAVIDGAKLLGFVKQTDIKGASRLIAKKLGCNVFGLCSDNRCMSRCMGCPSETGDVQTVRFHLSDSNAPYSQWTLLPIGNNGEFNLKIDGSYGYLTYKKTAKGDYQLTLTTQLSDETKFRFVAVE